ncbi:zinc-binding alcohol dehydrogenase family protein [Thioclava sp. GXIMD4216]|uniref:zinc-binding alcohol dehydrogenase family protein n=1 Tax=Thioclava sp. GXIMD4216 TaxID=3131929 RepID=UPI0030CD001C
MKAVGLWQALPANAPEALIDHEIPVPEPGLSDLLVRVEAISVNPADARVRMRKANDGKFQVLGWDVAGTVIKAGRDAAGFVPGDAVFYAGDLTRPGGNAELHVIEAALVARRPETIAASSAAAIPLTALTVWESLFDRLALPEPGEADAPLGKTLLVVGGAGGVGSMAIQIAKLLPGLNVIATASREASRDWCLSLGADAVIDHSTDMPAQIATRGLPAPDLILLAADPDGHFPALAQLIAPQGRICCIVPFDAPPDMNLLMQKSASLAWEFMFTRAMFATPDRARQGEILAKVATLIDAGRLTPPAPQELGPITAQTLLAAHRHIEGKRTIGKLVLAGFPSDL